MMNENEKLRQYCQHTKDRLSEDRLHVSRELHLNVATMIMVNDAFLQAVRAPAVGHPIDKNLLSTINKNAY
jgi:hypothetical protein